MKTINHLTYNLQISYVNDSGSNVFIDIKLQDDGLEVKSFKIGDVCITEETINGRILSGTFESQNSVCGYKYNYDKGADEYLVNINPEIALNDSVNLINKTKMDTTFLSARMVLSSIMREDFRVISLNQGNLTISKTISAENENSEKCLFQENLYLTKFENETSFTEKQSEQIFQIDDKRDDSFKSKLKNLIEIANQNPSGYKELIAAKENIQQVPETLGN